MNIDFLAQYAVYGVAIVGALAFCVSLITEVTKSIGFFAKIPTTLQVVVLSLVLTIITYAVIGSTTDLGLVWYGFVGAVVGGFVVAFITMYGWEKLSELWKRFKKTEDK